MAEIFVEDWLIYDPYNHRLHLVIWGTGSHLLNMRMSQMDYENQGKLADMIRIRYNKSMKPDLKRMWEVVMVEAIKYKQDLMHPLKMLRYEYACLGLTTYWAHRVKIKQNIQRLYAQSAFWKTEYEQKEKENEAPPEDTE